jgi:hypothetical protein
MDPKKYVDVPPAILLHAVISFVDSKVPWIQPNDIDLKKLYGNKEMAPSVCPRIIGGEGLIDPKRRRAR